MTRDLRDPHGLTYNPERRYGCTVCPWTGDDPDAAQAHVDYLTEHPRGWMGLAEEHPVTDRLAGRTQSRSVMHRHTYGRAAAPSSYEHSHPNPDGTTF